MFITRPAAAIAIAAAGLAIVVAGTTGLLLTRQSTPAMRPPPRGVATVAAPATAAPGFASEGSGASTAPTAGPARSATPGSRQTGFETVAPSAIADPVSLTIPL